MKTPDQAPMFVSIGDARREADAAQRIDKWLCVARVVKTRSLATKLVEAGHVRIGGVRTTNAAKMLHGGEVLTIALERHVRVLRVVAEADRRGPYREAALLFAELGERQSDKPCHAAVEGLGSGLGKGADGLGEASGEQT